MHWRRAEEESWRAHYEERGFATWEAWRMRYFTLSRPEQRTWTLEDVIDLQYWYIAGFNGGKKYWPAGAAMATYAEIAQSPILPDNAKVKNLIDALHETTFIATRCGGEVVLVDGFHRAAAYAYRVARGLPVPHCTVYMAEIPPEEKVLFDNFRTAIPRLQNERS